MYMCFVDFGIWLGRFEDMSSTHRHEDSGVGSDTLSEASSGDGPGTDIVVGMHGPCLSRVLFVKKYNLRSEGSMLYMGGSSENPLCGQLKVVCHGANLN